MTDFETSPQEIKYLRQWVLWKLVKKPGDKKPTKVPYRTNHEPASSTNPEHWSSFDEACKAFDPAKYSGIGYVFAPDDPYVGIDLDDCRNAETGAIAQWAQDIINDFGSYAEVSPSGTGVKIWAKGELPIAESGRKVKYAGGQVEAYQHSRYFAVTGQAIGDNGIAEAPAAIGRLWGKVFAAPTVTRDEPAADVDRCRAALAEVPDSISGERGHDRMLEACCTILRWGFDLDSETGQELVRQYNAERCSPPWSDKELRHKIKSAQSKVMRGNEFGIIAKKAGAGFDLEETDYADFMDEKIAQRFIVDQAVVQNQHFIIGGPSKTFKTSILLDLGVSVANGVPFLGNFDIVNPCPVLIVSGESGRATIQETLRRVERAYGIMNRKRGMFHLAFKLPKLANPGHLEAVERVIRNRETGLCLIDPAYLSAKPAKGETSDVFSMGPTLAGYGEIGEATGCTMGLVHHTRKPVKGQRYSKTTIDDLSQSGFSEWVRQWLLLGRRGPRRNGKSQLFLSVGGSAGHGGEWELDIDEGEAGLTGRIWSTDVRQNNEDEDGGHESVKAKDDPVLESQILAAVLGEPGIAPTTLATKISRGYACTVKPVLDRLESQLQIEVRQGKNGKEIHPSMFA